jgi:hypothetical protein
MNREPVDDFEPVSQWLRSEQPPFSEEDRAVMRRGVWREIEARAAAQGAFRPARLVFAGAAVLAAVLVAVLWLRPLPGAPVVPALAAVTTSAAPVVAAVQRLPVEDSPRPPAAAHVRTYARPRRREAEGVPVRIEFQTANPEVRIIWLVKKGEAAPRPFSSGRHQEVS